MQLARYNLLLICTISYGSLWGNIFTTTRSLSWKKRVFHLERDTRTILINIIVRPPSMTPQFLILDRAIAQPYCFC